MSAPMKIGLAEFEVARGDDGELYMIAGGYGRPSAVVAKFLGEREASVARALIDRGIHDIAPIDWSTGDFIDPMTPDREGGPQ